MTPRTIQLQARVARLDAILFARNPYGVEEEEQGVGQIGKLGAGAGAVGGLAGGLMLPGIAKRTTIQGISREGLPGLKAYTYL